MSEMPEMTIKVEMPEKAETPPKCKRKSISLEVKMNILQDVDTGILTKKQIADKYCIATSTLSTILKGRQKIDSHIAKGSISGSVKRLRFCAHENLEQQLVDWLKHMRAFQIPVTGALIKSTAREMCTQLGIQNFESSDGWLWRFQKRHNISTHSASWDAAKVHEESAADWLKQFHVKKHAYSDKNVFSIAETGVFFNLLPDRSFDYRGVKCYRGTKSKDRVTAVLCCNADGSEKLKLWVIGKYPNPRCFKNIDILTLPCTYTHHQKAWIDHVAFREWIVNFQRRMASEGRKILLTLDSCTAHTCDNLFLPNIEVIFFPTNTNTKVQPLLQGITHCFKREFRRLLVNAAVINLEADQPPVKWNILQAVRALSSAWNSIRADTIRNCFLKAWPSPNENMESGSAELEEWNWNKNFMGTPDLPFDDFVNIDNDVCIAETGKRLLGNEIEEESDEGEEEDHDEVLSKPSRKEVMEALAVIQRLGDTTDVDSDFTLAFHKIHSVCDRNTRSTLTE